MTRIARLWMACAACAVGCANQGGEGPAASDAGADVASLLHGGRPDAAIGTSGASNGASGTSSPNGGAKSGTAASGAPGPSGTTGASGTSAGTTGAASTNSDKYGTPFTGGVYHLGPVDFAESEWHNACAPLTKYDPRVQQAEGVLLAGLWNGVPDVESACDACIWVQTKAGKSALLRVVTYGDTSPNSIDVSPEAYALLHSGEHPRDMTWQFAKCPETGPIMYEFQTGSNQWWTSFWVRNARVPLTKIEIKSANHPDWVALQRGSDGTLTDASGFGAGPFSVRLTGVDGQTIVDTFEWPGSGIAGAFLTGAGNFK